MCLSSVSGYRPIILALVTRDLILAFPVTYLAKTRQNLLWSDAVAEDAIVWSTLLSILPSLTGEEDVSDGQCLEQRRWLSAVPAV